MDLLDKSLTGKKKQKNKKRRTKTASGNLSWPNWTDCVRVVLWKNKCIRTCARNDCASSVSMSLVRQRSRVIQRAGEHSDSHSVVSASAVRISLTHPYPSHFLYPRFKKKSVSGLWATARHLPSPAAKLLTPPWAENRRGGTHTPADEFLEMFGTTKLGCVTGNLLGLVLADISDTSLSTQEGFCFNQSPSWPQTQTPAEGGRLGESPQVYHLGSAQDRLAACACVWVRGVGGVLQCSTIQCCVYCFSL